MAVGAVTDVYFIVPLATFELQRLAIDGLEPDRRESQDGPEVQAGRVKLRLA